MSSTPKETREEFAERERMADLMSRPNAEQFVASLNPDEENGAYYFCLQKTGVPAIDRIAHMINYAGSGWHNTDAWSETSVYWDFCAVDGIQAALDQAAEEWRKKNE